MKKFLIFTILQLACIAFTPKQTTWMAIGDSITYLNDHTDETGNRVTKGYMTRVVEALPSLNYINRGRNGWTAWHFAKEIETLDFVKADVYSIFLGTNDWWRGRPLGTLDDYKNNTGLNTTFGCFRIIITKLRSLNKHTKIILITPMQRGDFVYLTNLKNNAYGSYKQKDGQSLSQFADAVISIGKFEKLPVVDLYNNSGITLENMVKFKRLKDPATGGYKNYSYPESTGIPFDPGVDDHPYPVEASDMTYDGLHPSDKGCESIARMVIEAMKKIKIRN